MVSPAETCIATSLSSRRPFRRSPGFHRDALPQVPHEAEPPPFYPLSPPTPLFIYCVRVVVDYI